MTRIEIFRDGEYKTIFQCDECGKTVELVFPELPPKGWVVLRSFKNGKANYVRGIKIWTANGLIFCSKDCSMIWENRHG